MKKYFLIALCAFCLADIAQAQRIVNPNGNVTVNNEVISTAAFRAKTTELKTALNANDFTKAQSLWYPICRATFLKGDQLQRQQNSTGADAHYQLSARMKTLSQNIPGNKAVMLQLLAEMDTAY